MNTSKANTKNDARYRARTALLSALTLAGLVGAVPGALAQCNCEFKVQAGKEVTLTEDVTYDCFKVDGVLNIAAGVTLTLDGDPCAESKVDGFINLLGSGSVLAFSSNNHTVSGSGLIDGRHNSARIDIMSAITVTIGADLTVHGAMQIRAVSGTFDNDGLVEADNAATNDDTLECYSGTFAGSGEYKVATSGATLKFDSGISDTGLAADFTVGGGTLDIDEEVVTTGNLTFTGGTISVAANKTFQAS